MSFNGTKVANNFYQGPAGAALSVPSGQPQPLLQPAAPGKQPDINTTLVEALKQEFLRRHAQQPFNPAGQQPAFNWQTELDIVLNNLVNNIKQQLSSALVSPVNHSYYVNLTNKKTDFSFFPKDYHINLIIGSNDFNTLPKTPREKQIYFHNLTGVDGAAAVEELSNLYEYQITFYSYSKELLQAKLKGKKVVLSVDAKSGAKQANSHERYITGKIKQITWVQSASLMKNEQNDKYHLYCYRIIIEPDLAALKQRINSRVFLNKSFKEIIEEIAKDYKNTIIFNFDGVSYSNKFPICIQREESDWDFLRRLLQHIGALFYFQHEKEGTQKVIIIDEKTNYKSCAFAEPPVYIPGSATGIGLLSTEQEQLFKNLQGKARLLPTAFGLFDWELNDASDDIKVVSTSFDPDNPDKALRYEGQAKQGEGPESLLTHFNYTTTGQAGAETLVKRYKERVAASMVSARTQTNFFDMTVGHTFKKEGEEYLITKIEFEIRKLTEQDFLLATNQAFGFGYYPQLTATLTCIPVTDNVPRAYYPDLPPSKMQGTQRARVVTSDGKLTAQGSNKADADASNRIWIGLDFETKNPPNSTTYTPIRTANGRNGITTSPAIGSMINVEFDQETGWISFPHFGEGPYYYPKNFETLFVKEEKLDNNNTVVLANPKLNEKDNDLSYIILYDGAGKEITKLYAKKDFRANAEGYMYFNAGGEPDNKRRVDEDKDPKNNLPAAYARLGTANNVLILDDSKGNAILDVKEGLTIRTKNVTLTFTKDGDFQLLNRNNKYSFTLDKEGKVVLGSDSDLKVTTQKNLGLESVMKTELKAASYELNSETTVKQTAKLIETKADAITNEAKLVRQKATITQHG